MNQSNSDSPARVTLKLKTGPRKTAEPSSNQPVPRPQSKANQKPGAEWSDEYKQRMQADMDALASRHPGKMDRT
jgi:hypothetical protein